jgi:hypothetical protein
MSNCLNTRTINDNILKVCKKNDFAGYDPFDGLNSSLFSCFPQLKPSVFGLAFLQFNKRSIVNFRSVLGVRQQRNPKGIGLFILGLLEDYQRTNNNELLKLAFNLADWLLDNISDQSMWKHSCWGYHFDWNARAFFVPKGKPNIITTVYVSQALYALSKFTENLKYINAAFDSADFIVNSLYTEEGGRCFFAYIPGENTFVHNASLWGAAWVGFVATKKNNTFLKNKAIRVAEQSISEQAEDGSWVYGVRNHHQFIDGFHTGYNLEALKFLQNSIAVDNLNKSIEKGLVFYKNHLFEKDGTAKYYHNNVYPLDMHCVSQAVLTLLKVGGTSEDYLLAKKIIQKSIDTLYLKKQQHFCYQKHRLYNNKINYIRWTQAWAYYSFAHFNNFHLNTENV